MTTQHKDPRAVIELLVTALENAEGHKLGCKIHAFGDHCTCGFDAQINAALTAGRESLEQMQGEAVPIEGSEAADEAIHAMLKARQWPSSSMNAARAGWRAARLYTHPQASEPPSSKCGTQEFKSYLAECEACCIEPDVAGAFNAGLLAKASEPAPSTAGESAKTCCGQDEFCPTCEPATFAAQPAQGEPPHQGKNHEQQIRSEMGAVGGQQPMQSTRSGGNSNPTVLVSRIEALLALDAAGALVPHGIGGHARSLLKSAAALLQPTPDARPVGELTPDERMAIIELLDKDGHDGTDFEADCPWCTARQKLAAARIHRVTNND